MKRGVVLALSLAVILCCSQIAQAGRVVLTGHDDDFHQSAAAKAAVSAFLTYVRATAPTPSKPVLTFDHGTELTSLLTSIGVTFTNIDPNVGVPAASNFDVATYSAIVIASDTSCGGCDNNATSSANLAAAAASFATFFNAGGGIIGLAGASNPNYYSFVPASATVAGLVTCSSCFTQTADGAAAGLPAVNGDFPHNFFAFPGTGGVDVHYKVFETYTGPSTVGTLTNQPFGLFFEGSIGGGGLGGATVPTLGFTGKILMFLALAGASLLIIRRMA
jgi:hypothetical protein